MLVLFAMPKKMFNGVSVPVTSLAGAGVSGNDVGRRQTVARPHRARDDGFESLFELGVLGVREVSKFAHKIRRGRLDVDPLRELMHVFSVPFMFGVLLQVLLGLDWGEVAKGSLSEAREKSCADPMLEDLCYMLGGVLS